jgi:hypothetical protein
MGDAVAPKSAVDKWQVPYRQKPAAFTKAHLLHYTANLKSQSTSIYASLFGFLRFLAFKPFLTIGEQEFFNPVKAKNKYLNQLSLIPFHSF